MSTELKTILDSFKAFNAANKDAAADVQFSEFVKMVTSAGEQAPEEVKAPLTNLMVLHLQSQFSNFADKEEYKHLSSLGNQAEVDSVNGVFSSYTGTEAISTALYGINPVYSQSFELLGDEFYQLHSTLQQPAAPVHDEA